MKKIVFAFTMMMICAAAMAQTPRSVLDRAAAVISNPGGITATFKMTGGMGNASGTISVKGKKFQASSPVATIWFNGKTMWTYMKKNDEVSITTPNDAQLQKINPYNFINLYKKGYDMMMSSAANSHTVHLTAQGNQNIQEIFITVDKKSFHPTQVKMLQGKRWTTFDISELKTVTLSDSMFSFNSKDFPQAEVIDLR